MGTCSPRNTLLDMSYWHSSEYTEVFLSDDCLFFYLIQEMQKRKVTKPYAPIADGTSAEVILKEGICTWSPQQVPASVPVSSTFGSSTDWIWKQVLLGNTTRGVLLTSGQMNRLIVSFPYGFEHFTLRGFRFDHDYYLSLLSTLFLHN